VNSSFAAYWIVPDFLLGIFPLWIDAMTGAWNELEPASKTVYLEEKEKEGGITKED
jgi:hypothetical protein